MSHRVLWAAIIIILLLLLALVALSTAESAVTANLTPAATEFVYLPLLFSHRTPTATPTPRPTPTLTPPPGGYWRGEYWDNPDLKGAPVLVRDDGKVDFYWGYDSPDPRVPRDWFSARWTKTVDFGATNDFWITMAFDDGVRLWIDDELLIDAWDNVGFRVVGISAELSLDVPIIVEYRERTGEAHVQLEIDTLVLSAAPGMADDG